MGAETSAHRDGKRSQEEQEEATGVEKRIQEAAGTGVVVDPKLPQKNGQISGLGSLNGHSEDNALAEVGQTDGVSVSQKEEAPGTMDIVQDEVAPQVNGEKEEKESPGANEISVAEEKAAEEKPDETNEVGFKKIFRFVGFKFTLKKDKSEEKEPVKLLTVKDKEEDIKADVTEDASVKSEEKEAETATTKADAPEAIEECTASESPEDAAAVAAEAVEGEEAPKEEEAESSPPSQEVTVSPFKKFFGGGLFSNLRKKASIKKSKEEEEEKAAGEETKEADETGEVAGEEVEKAEAEEEAKEAKSTATPEEVKPESTPEPEAAAPEESKEEVAVETPASDGTDESAPVVEKAEEVLEGEKAPAEVTNEAELLSSQEKVKAHGSPLKKLFTGAGLKKLSARKHKSKKAEAKVTESGEQVTEQLQSSSESAESQKPDSAATSPEESGEHAIVVEAGQAEPSQEAEGEVTSDGEKKKEGIMPWSSFKKLVTPKKRVKRPSESEDEATGEKPVKSATLSSTESAASVDKCSDEEVKEDKATEEEPKTENAEKLESSSEEPKKKMDTSVSWEALMCMGGAKKRTRRTSDSDDEETKIEEEAVAATEAGEEQEAVEAPIVASQEADAEVEVEASPEAGTSPPEKESTWDTLKRFMRSKPKAEEKVEEAAEQVVSDSEVAKEESSSFSLRKLLPGRRKKKAEKPSAEVGSGEDDSDTPAVVPLSEYDAEAKEEAAVEVLQISVEVPTVNQAKVSAEDRAPSWIPAISVTEDEDDKQLSDIPEEAENVATPKSADTTIADDIEGHGEQILSTAEVVLVVPAPPAETSPVPEAPESETTAVVLETAVVQVSDIPCQTTVTVEDAPLEVASAETEHEPPLKQAESEMKVILEPHVPEEATVMCTGLETTEIAPVALEEPVTATLECVAVINEVLPTEILVEEKALLPEDAVASEDAVFGAQVQQVETTELEPALGDIACEVLPEFQAASEGQEPEIELVAAVNALHDASEFVQPAELSDNSPKTVLVEPIAPTIEAAVVTASVEVTEAHVETKEKEMDLEQSTATEEIASLGEMVQVTAQEMATTLSGTAKDTVTEGVEPAVTADVDGVVAKETEVLSSPLTQEEPRVLPLDVQESKTVSVEVAEAVVDVGMGVAESEVTVVLEQVSEKAQDEVTAENADAIEEQGMVIAKAVIQDAMDTVSEAQAEPEEPTTLSPVQAVATIEKEIDVETEMPVVTDTVAIEAPEEPESPEILHATVEVTSSVLVEVVESLDAPTEEEKEEEKEPAEAIKQAVEETISEAIVIEEVEVVEINTEVVEINTESQTNGMEEEVVNEEVKPAEEKEVAEEVEAEVSPVVEEKEPMPKLHVPTQIVLQVAQVVEATLEEESVVEFGNGPVNDLQTQVEEPQTDVSTEEAAPVTETEKKATAKCAEVMAQVIEVIEEAVKEIEPISTEITAAS